MATLILVACTSDPDPTLDLDPTTIAAETTVETAETAAATDPPTTTIESTTATSEAAETSTTSAPTTSTTADTVQSTTSEPPPIESSTPTVVDPVAAKIEADFRAGVDAKLQCYYEPTSCDYAAVAIPGSPLDKNIRGTVGDLIASNQRAVIGHGTFRYSVESISIAGESALVTSCTFDSVVIFDIGDPSVADDDTVINDNASYTRVEWSLILIDGRWSQYSGLVLEPTLGTPQCVV